eukprot:8054320-Heterocapsa_arctica.AAC.1
MPPKVSKNPNHPKECPGTIQRNVRECMLFCSRTFLLMVRVLRDFRRRRAAVRADIKRLPSGHYIPGKVVGLELQADTSFQAELTAGTTKNNSRGLFLCNHII